MVYPDRHKSLGHPGVPKLVQIPLGITDFDEKDLAKQEAARMKDEELDHMSHRIYDSDYQLVWVVKNQSFDFRNKEEGRWWKRHF